MIPEEYLKMVNFDDKIKPLVLRYASIVSAEKDRELAAARERIAELEKEVYNALDALCDMWNQYCGDRYGHMCMSAGENAAGVLGEYKLLKNDNGYGGEVDWDRLVELKKQINPL